MKTIMNEVLKESNITANIIEQINDTQTINIVINQDENEKRTKCEIYTRVMWYFRPVSQFNVWKKSEFYSRECFKEQKTANSKFICEYK